MLGRFVFVAVALISAANCSQHVAPTRTGPDGALAIVKQYAETNFPKGTFQPDGARLQYVVTDKGSEWNAFLGPVEHMGGGLQLIIRKRDMKVVSALRTQ